MPRTSLSPYPRAPNASPGNVPSGVFVSCRHSTPGCASEIRRRTRSRRRRTELMFQVATVSATVFPPKCLLWAPARPASDDGDLEIGEAVDMAVHLVALDHGLDPLRRPRIDEIARRQ